MSNGEHGWSVSTQVVISAQSIDAFFVCSCAVYVRDTATATVFFFIVFFPVVTIVFLNIWHFVVVCVLEMANVAFYFCIYFINPIFPFVYLFIFCFFFFFFFLVCGPNSYASP